MFRAINRVFRRGKDEDDFFDTEIIADSDVVLYLLSEKKIPNIIEFAYNMGLPLKTCFYDIFEARMAMITESRPMRLIVMEQGLGKFTNVLNRRELAEIVSLCDKYKKAYIFCCDKSLKKDISEEYKVEFRSKDVIWDNYEGVYSALLKVKKLGERYVVFKDRVDENVGEVERALRFTGERVENRVDTERFSGVPFFFEQEDITTGSIEGFRVEIREFRDISI